MPLFFLSYSHVPVHRAGRSPDFDRLVFRFFEDLCGHLAAAGGPEGNAAGFVERPGTPAEETLRALADCRVFVPLYAKRYFTDPKCGRHWTAATTGPADTRPAVVPVLWTPYPPAALPRAAQYDLPAMPGDGDEAEEEYAATGLHQMLQLGEELGDGRAGDRAGRITAWLARRVLYAAATVPAPPGDRHVPGPLTALDNAFTAPLPAPPTLRITVLAPTEEQLPIGRDESRYGPAAEDWRPYGPALGPLADQVRALARNLGFTPDLVAFDKPRAELRGTAVPDAPWVLVVDPWALENPRVAAQVREFDAVRRPWTAVLSVLPEDDPQTKERSERLTRLLHTCFPRFLREGRAGEQNAVRGLPDADVFALWFSELAESARMRYLRYIHSQLSAGGDGTGDRTEGRP
ncbi:MULTISPECIES: FxsC protein [Streptomyces]|uniref:FxsC protein n=1 Tax=Streptomyces TaxID=1883 RepID=UPI0029A72AA3|nr:MULTISPECIES: FxsC protein [unclassified Streptomyces]MDX3092629.1 FxsC protein [Streptomyces sp. ME12-02E]MDX3335989.1 FxsC protein [Streptomyces sp. ME02-6978a]